MNEELLRKIDEMIESCEQALVDTTICLVNINSEKSDPLPGAPFGTGPRKVLDTVLEMGKAEDFCTTDYGVGVVSLSMEPGQPDLGIWAHGDVVPAGEGWSFEPFNATVYKDCIIGRGVTDNKGQLAAVFHLLKIFKELGIELNYNPALYVGSNEEMGMYDMRGIPGNPDAKGFCNVCTPPRLSLVPDSSFPVGYGARGMTSFFVRSKMPLKDCTLTAGLNDRPGNADAVFADKKLPATIPGCTVDNNTVTVFSAPAHTSHPDPNGNMIAILAKVLVENNLVCDEDKAILQFYREIAMDIHGSMFGLDVKSTEMPTTIVYAKTITSHDGYPTLELRVRYPIELTFEQILENMQKVSARRGFEVFGEPGHPAYIYPKDTPVVRTLARIANEIVGVEKKPYVNGSTYAHYLPNGYIFGMDGNLPPESFPKDRGGAHGIDEAVSIARLKRAMRIYARALLALNEIEW